MIYFRIDKWTESMLSITSSQECSINHPINHPIIDNGNNAVDPNQNEENLPDVNQIDNNENNNDNGAPVVNHSGNNIDAFGQGEGEGECQFCFCILCVTTIRHLWFGGPSRPHARNAQLRKAKHKRFWKMMDDRGAWRHPRYLRKKQRLLQTDEETVVTDREVMPDCILNVVSSAYPNPPGQPYMGHKWW